MIEFKPVRLEDRAVIERYTMPSGICNCDLAFANMYCWQAVFHSAWAEIGGFLVIRFQIDGGERIGYMQPVGEGDFGPILPLLREDAHAHGQRLRIIGLTDEGRDTIRRIVPCHFAFESDRALEDYVYNADDLRNLTGRRYQPKRNHINRFEAAYDYRYEELTPALAPECMRLEREWRAGHDSHAAELTAEQRAACSLSTRSRARSRRRTETGFITMRRSRPTARSCSSAPPAASRLFRFSGRLRPQQSTISPAVQRIWKTLAVTDRAARILFVPTA